MSTSVGRIILIVLITPVVYPVAFLTGLMDMILFRKRSSFDEKPAESIHLASDAEIRELEEGKKTVLETLRQLKEKEKSIRDAIVRQETEFTQQRNSAIAELNRETAKKRNELEQEIAKLRTQAGEEIRMQYEKKLAELEGELTDRKKQLEKELMEKRREAEVALESELAAKRKQMEAEIGLQRDKVLAELERELADRRKALGEELKDRQLEAIKQIQDWTEKETERLRKKMEADFNAELQEMKKELDKRIQAEPDEKK